MDCPKNKAHKTLMIEDPSLYDGISYIYCYDCKKLYDRWTNNDVTDKFPDIVKQFKEEEIKRYFVKHPYKNNKWMEFNTLSEANEFMEDVVE